LEQLKQLGLDPLPAGDLKLAVEMCQHAPPEMVVSGRMEWAAELATIQRRVPVILAGHQEPDSDILLQALRSGLADVWTLPMDDAFMSGRVEEILSRQAAAAGQAEKRLGQYVADLQRDQRAGRYIQMGMLPPNPMAIDRYRFQHRIVPSLILSGDFVDYFRITDRHFAFYVADVSGHGASSAFVTVLLKNFSRRLRREYRPSMLTEPGEILEWFNRELLEQNIDKHVAVIMAIGDLESDTVCLANAGHFPPTIHVRSSAESGSRASFIEQKGKPVGLFDEVSYEARQVELASGDRLVVFSDGVLDALDGMDLSQKEALLLEAAANDGDMNSIWHAMGVDPSAEAPDDMTCLTVRRES
ncbi:MAG: SpoIIE family protein phosphatase, partial [Gammaproteobacteria bacterium]|nr:SpoIIE family protein phosphatase [Gammaproteobacteria bacterium]